MSPAQIAAFCFLIARRQDVESHRTLSLMALANSGDAKAITDQLAQWEKEAS